MRSAICGVASNWLAAPFLYMIDDLFESIAGELKIIGFDCVYSERNDYEYIMMVYNSTIRVGHVRCIFSSGLMSLRLYRLYSNDNKLEFLIDDFDIDRLLVFFING